MRPPNVSHHAQMLRLVQLLSAVSHHPPPKLWRPRARFPAAPTCLLLAGGVVVRRVLQLVGLADHLRQAALPQFHGVYISPSVLLGSLAQPPSFITMSNHKRMVCASVYCTHNRGALGPLLTSHITLVLQEEIPPFYSTLA